ncbi:AbrB/MazE/SpoVT family DNA-binding domain-containing protein [Limosilactobacillus caccae]|uniref:AbrB/MazE/SpoVT family DNA-binding domain-containing protein n=1 Tax=Limosilactobacillus caccae TaxID=1926284 RepID=UPI00117A0E3B|nr:AbrB/MazE/SpoVT family DNA-binding domain-containing protein [Limosilactobacillus caccae]
MQNQKGTLTNSLSVRIPKKILDSFKLGNEDKLSYKVEDDKRILIPEKKKAH